MVVGGECNVEEALARQASGAQRAAIQAVSFGTLRWYLRLAPAVLPLLSRPEPQTDLKLRTLLVTAVHQLEYSTHPHGTTVAAAATVLCDRRSLRPRAGFSTRPGSSFL